MPFHTILLLLSVKEIGNIRGELLLFTNPVICFLKYFMYNKNKEQSQNKKTAVLVTLTVNAIARSLKGISRIKKVIHLSCWASSRVDYFFCFKAIIETIKLVNAIIIIIV